MILTAALRVKAGKKKQQSIDIMKNMIEDLRERGPLTENPTEAKRLTDSIDSHTRALKALEAVYIPEEV